TGMIYLYHTADDGKTWLITPMSARIVIPPPSAEYQPVPQIEMLSPTDGWMLAVDAATEKQALYQTVDGGQVWTKPASLPDSLVPADQSSGIEFPYIDFLDLRAAWAIDTFGYLQLTNDSGKTWTPLNPRIAPTF